MRDRTSDVRGCGADATAPVGSRPLGASPYGVQDMAGNVFEWVADWYSELSYAGTCASGCADPRGPPEGRYHVARGGGFGSRPFALRAWYRGVILFPTGPLHQRGIRCCRSLP
jgi:iron(II)-dependent oxidoreductase